MIGHDSIKSFVQGTLGCRCPEEVFRSIDCRFNVRLNGATVVCAVIIGSRLLLYVVDDDEGALEEKRLAFYVAEGKRERDSKGLNRFRLVIVAKTEAIGERLQKAFQTLKNADDRIHLHVIGREENIFASAASRSNKT